MELLNMTAFGDARRNELLEFVRDAFADRDMPISVVEPGHSATVEYADALHFSGIVWQAVISDDLEKFMDAVHGFSPAAFCYYLPGILCASIRDNRPDLLVCNSLLSMLDRSNSPSSWDDFFRNRWTKLSGKEYEAIQRWVLWLSDFEPPLYSDATLSRAYDTLDLLANQVRATPMASR